MANDTQNTSGSGASGSGAGAGAGTLGIAGTLQTQQQQVVEQQRRDNDAAREREAQAARDASEDAVLVAQRAADAAADAAKVAEQRAKDLTDGVVEVTVPQPGLTLRSAANGVQHFRPGTQKLPKATADALGLTAAHSPTFATSGDPVADRAVRRTLERAGVKEHGTQADTTQTHNSMRGEEGEGKPDDDTEPTTRAGKRAASRQAKSTRTITEIREQGADKVREQYDTAVRGGKVTPIADGQGSGAEGAVVTDDMARALFESENPDAK